MAGFSTLVALQFVLAFVVAFRPGVAPLMLAVVVAMVACLLFPRALLVLALVATVFSQRVGPSSLDLSVTDAVGLAALVAALRFIPWRDPLLRRVLVALALYVGLLAVTIIGHPSVRVLLDLGHRGVLFAGPLLIGVAIVRSGTTRTALRAFVLTAAVAAGSAVVDSASNGFEPAYALALNKNHAGLILALGFLVLWVAPRRVQWPSVVIYGLQGALVLGLVATQARGAAIGLALALGLRAVGRRRTRRGMAAAVGAVAITLGLLAFAAISVKQTDLDRPVSERQFNAVNTRLATYESAIDIWRQNRFIGAGLSYWTDPSRSLLSPHNLVVSELAEGGLIGLTGVVVLLATTVVTLRRRHGDLVDLGLSALVLRIAQGMVDIFWVAGPLTAPMILVGMALVDEPDDADDPHGSASRAALVRGGRWSTSGPMTEVEVHQQIPL